jgi:hypothetical protein
MMLEKQHIKKWVETEYLTSTERNLRLLNCSLLADEHYCEMCGKKIIPCEEGCINSGALYYHWVVCRECQPKLPWRIQHYWYLQTPEWKKRWRATRRRDKYICQVCHKNKATQVHHLNYDHWKNEPLDDLISVCRLCHMSLHNIPDIPKF